MHGICLGHRETFFGNPQTVLDSSQTPHQGILHSTNQSATGGIPVQRSTGRPVAKGEGQIGGTVAMPSFARRPSTMTSLSGGNTTVFYGSAQTASLGASLRYHVGRLDSKHR